MLPAMLDHLWQSTLLALGVGLLAVAFRRVRAPVRYGLWFAASVKFLVPFAALMALGRLLAPAVGPPVEAKPGAILIEQATQPFSQSYSTAAAPVAHGAPGFDPALIILGVWALGCATVLIIWSVRWARVRWAVRQATPLALPAPMPVLASPTLLEPGLVGLWRPVLIIPKSLPDQLTQPEFDALVAHEACHLRRHDNLTAAIHMLVEALFWFHPLVWWIGARLIDERERACDEAVVRSGHDRAAYARTLVECCRLYLHSPLPCVAGASGTNLARRVEMIMTAPPCSSLSRSRKALLLAAGVCALASPVAAGWMTSPTGQQATKRVAAAAVRIADERSPHVALTGASPEPNDVAKAITVAQGKSLPAPDLALAEVARVSISPIANVEISKASLLPVANVQMPEADEPLRPGHYVQESGAKQSLDCRDRDALPPRWYTLSTPLIAPGHVIANFHYQLRGDGRCETKWPSDSPSARCEVVIDKPERKTVRFQLLTDGDYCFSYGAFVRDGSQHDGEAQGTLTEPGAVTRSEMVLSYDVR